MAKETPEKLIEGAYKKLEKGEPRKARQRAEKALELEPGNLEARFVRALALLEECVPDESELEGDEPPKPTKAQRDAFIEAKDELENLSNLEHAPALIELATLTIAHAFCGGEDEDDHEHQDAGPIIERAIAAANKAGDPDLVEKAWGLALEAYLEMPAREAGPKLVATMEKGLAGHPELAAMIDVARGLVAFFQGEWQAAHDRLAPAEDKAPSEEIAALAAHYDGCALERLGKLDEAEDRLDRAAHLDERFVAPVRLSPEEFDKVVEESLEELPPEIAEKAKEFRILREDWPAEERVRKEGTDPLLLGEFRGFNAAERPSLDQTRPPELPSEIVLYKLNLEKICVDEDELRDQIATTVFHELGHALGFEEDGVADMGLA